MLNKDDKAKLGCSQALALEALKQAGDRGITTMEGIRIAGSRFPARTHELRNLGHIITVERISGTRLEFKYCWKGFDESGQLLLFTKAA